MRYNEIGKASEPYNRQKNFNSSNFLLIGPIILLMFISLPFSCSNISPLNPTASLQPPLGLKASIGIDKFVVLTFYSANNEDDFDGFNVYISESNNVAATISSALPLTPDGIVPTIRSKPLDVDSNKLRAYTVSYRDNKGTPLSSGVRYYFILRAHSSNSQVSPPSNEASALVP